MDKIPVPTTFALVLALILAGGCDAQENDESLPDGVVRWEENGHRYQAILVPEGISWTDAQAAAQQRGDGWHLATITSAAENAFLYDLVRADPGYWNCCLSNNSTGPWLGGQEVNPATREYVWVTGEPFVYANWGPREPFGNGDRIAFFGYQTFMGPHWNDVPAERLEYGYIVEKSN